MATMTQTVGLFVDAHEEASFFGFNTGKSLYLGEFPALVVDTAVVFDALVRILAVSVVGLFAEHNAQSIPDV
jgi:hypothetical protein